jgi:putative transposase
MRQFWVTVPGHRQLRTIARQHKLSRAARARLQWIMWHEDHGRNVALTCRHFAISRPTFYRWYPRYDPKRPETLEDRSSRPKRSRPPQTPIELVRAIRQLREANPRTGKDKLAVLLRREGWSCSASTVGRTLKRLRDRGILKEPRISPIKARRRRKLDARYAQRRPKGFCIDGPGHLQLDTLDVRPLPGVILKHFTAVDIASRINGLGLFSRATAATAARFLDELEQRLEFPIRSIQIDGGSEFMGEFEQACQQRAITLFVLPPRSPNLNGMVERAHLTHITEFYEVTDAAGDLASLRPALAEWELRYNTWRPHQALGYKTPAEALAVYNPDPTRKEAV